MKINFLDNKFPKEYRNRFFEIEKYILQTYNIKSYQFDYDTLDNKYYIKLRFNEVAFEIPVTIEDFNKTNKEYIFNKINDVIIDYIDCKYYLGKHIVRKELYKFLRGEI